jgi:hypothetical protein
LTPKAHLATKPELTPKAHLATKTELTQLPKITKITHVVANIVTNIANISYVSNIPHIGPTRIQHRRTPRCRRNVREPTGRGTEEGKVFRIRLLVIVVILLGLNQASLKQEGRGTEGEDQRQ